MDESCGFGRTNDRTHVDLFPRGIRGRPSIHSS